MVTVRISPPHPLPEGAEARRRKADEKGWWTAEAEGELGFVVRARTLRQLREAYLDELSEGGADLPRFEEVYQLDAKTLARISESVRARREADQEARRAAALLRSAAEHLTEIQGLSYRDAAELLGISHARIGQLLGR
jgi:hypothetical protein